MLGRIVRVYLPRYWFFEPYDKYANDFFDCVLEHIDVDISNLSQICKGGATRRSLVNSEMFIRYGRNLKTFKIIEAKRQTGERPGVEKANGEIRSFSPVRKVRHKISKVYGRDA